MSKRNLAPSSSPDVRYETDEDGTKLIIRKFNIPLPARSSLQSNILKAKSVFGQVTVNGPKEKWKYQHDVPEGKIYTRRVHDLNPKHESSPQSGESNDLSSSISSPQKKVLPTTLQNVQLSVSKALGGKDVILMAPKEQTTTVLSAVPVKGISQTVNTSLLKKNNTEKITLNNLPDNVIANSIQVVDSKIVNGKKVMYLKAFKGTGRVEKSANNVTSETKPHSSVEQNNKDTLTTTTNLTCGIEAGSNNVNPSEVNSDSSMQNASDVQQTDPQTGAPVSKLRSVLSQKLNVVAHDAKPVTNIVSVPPDCTTKNNDVRVNKCLSVVTPIIVPHSNVLVSPKPVLLQKTCDLKNGNVYFAGPVRTPAALFGCPTIASNVVNNSREVTLQLNPTSKADIDLSKKSTILPINNKNGVSYQIVSGSSENMTSVSSSGQQSDITFMPVDSTTPIILNTTSLTNSINSDIGKTSMTEAMLVLSQEGTTCRKGVINPNSKESSVQCEESNNACGSETNIVIFNKLANNLNLSKPSTNVLPKQNINYDDVMRRRKIALQYQHDMQKNRGLPRIERTIELPARKVKVVEISTQTSLFSLLEPGRMVEMYLNDESKDTRISSQQNKNALTNSDVELMKNKSLINNKETNMKGPSDAMNCTLNSNSNSNCNSETSEKTGPSLPKRMRLDEGDSNPETLRQLSVISQNPERECSFLQAPMDFEDFIQPHIEGMEKENLIESYNNKIPSNSQKYSELGFQNNNMKNINSLPLTCMQSTMNCSVNSNGVSDRSNSNIGTKLSKTQMRQLFMDFSQSLKQDEDGNLPIHNAVMDNDHRQVERQCLVLNGQKQSVNVKNIREETPLHFAVLCHDLKMVQLLLRYKAKIHLSDSVGNSALHMAIIWGNNIEILKALLAAIPSGSYGSCVLDEPNDEGYSPLHLCALHNKTNEAILLLKKNADVNIRDRKSGRTPLFHAIENARTELSRILIDSGASTTIPNFSGQTPLNASEAIMDTVLGHTEALRTSKSIGVPCTCINKKNTLQSENCVSKDKTNTNFTTNKIVEMTSCGNISDSFVLCKSVLQDR